MMVNYFPQVIYSIGTSFAGGGIGTPAYHAVLGLHYQGMLQRLLCGSSKHSEIPRDKIRIMGLISRALRKLAVYDTSRRLSHIHNVAYDLWASRHLEPADILHVWGNFGLRSLEQARFLGMITIVQRASSHPRWRIGLMKEEHRRWGLDFRVPEASHRRSVAELEIADYVLIPSQYVRDTFLANHFPERKLIQIPFGADIRRFHPADSAQRHPFRVLFVGTVTIGKGVLYLLEAWHQLGWQDAELWLVGRIAADVSPLLKQYIGMPGLRFLGHQKDIVRLYQQADVFAFPSIDEGSALVTYEALACGLPVVTTPNAGSVVRDGVEGSVVPIRDADALAADLERLRVDERLRWEMGKAARARAEEFTWKRHGDTLVEAYRQCLAGSERA